MIYRYTNDIGIQKQLNVGDKTKMVSIRLLSLT